jgi:hypothetical protein
MREEPLISIRSLSFVCILGLSTPAIPAADQPQLLAETGAWQAYKAPSGGAGSCYILSSPTERLPSGLRRGPAYLFVSRSPRDEIALELGFPLDTEARSTLTIGSQEFELGEQKERAWLLRADEQRRAVAAMKRGAIAKVQTTSARNNSSEDTYSLEGFTNAYETMMEGCR